ncbi:MAG: DUF4384 domain-containing protein [Pyrinomonadaceae bacterium]
MQHTKSHILFSVICLFILSGAVWAQTDDGSADRSITSLDFQKQRTNGGQSGTAGISSPSTRKPFGVKQKKNIAVITNSKRRYNLVKRIPIKKTAVAKTEKTNPVKTSADSRTKTEELGVTFWRLRPLQTDEDDAPTFPVRINNGTENWTAERVTSTTKFRKGDRVRFTIESSRTGFLYIVNRESYTDGTSGDAELIFPTLRTRGGDNQVTAGSLIEIPASTDSVPYFTIKPRRADYAGEELVAIISPVKIPGIEPGLRAQTVTREKVRKWLEEWGANVDIYDAADGEGIAYTATEAEASTTKSRALTQEEPLPQTIYRVQARANQPLLVSFQMQAKTP